MSLQIEVVTPARTITAKEVASLAVDTTMGEIEILPGHRPLMTLLETGSARLQFADGHTEIIATSSGILHLENDAAVLVVEEAVDVHHLEVQELEDAKMLAQKALQGVVTRGNLDQNALDQLSAKVRSELLKKLKK
ncbi:MAG: ATP synthase F1 subunit epsilon [Verrucomicrobiota bacterium]|nr:MAG: ATP synthase F1 subunit epsilon [Verrucomicrobiota bacterium]